MGRAVSLTSLHLEHVSGMDSCDLRTIGQYLLALGKPLNANKCDTIAQLFMVNSLNKNIPLNLMVCVSERFENNLKNTSDF